MKAVPATNAAPAPFALPGASAALSAAAADFAAAAATLTDAVRIANTDPGDAIRLLVPLCQWVPLSVPGSGPLSASINQGRNALAATMRVTACAALGRAAQDYQPMSYDDAQAVRALVCSTLDAEAIRAADDERDATYQALRALRTSVALDLEVRGASLARLIDVTTLVPMPALAEAWTLYQDTSRTPELVASADPPHPLFLPLTFSALSR